MKRICLIMLMLTLAGCSSTRTVTSTMKWPQVPAALMEPAEELAPLDPAQTRLSDLIDNANKDRKSTRLNSVTPISRMPSSA